jgi:two-component system cell cycle sensor histidine kinase/response regulator CckA
MEKKAVFEKELRLANEQLSQDFEEELSVERDEHKKNDDRHRQLLNQSRELGAAANKELRLENDHLLAESARELGLEHAGRQRAEATLSRIEAQMREVQKMEAVGRLAAGVAHDFNNILSVILGYGGLMLEDMAPDDPKRSDLGQILEAGGRAVGLTRQLLALSRQQVLEPRVLDLNALILGMDKMVRRMVGEDIQLKIALSPVLHKVKVDVSHIEQVIMNLVANARDAMPQGGALVIETADVELDGAYADAHLGAKPGPHVMLAVSDTGCGMDEATRAKIFEPFFTTKERGHGTGLGLSTVYGIIKQGGGDLWVYSEPGKGSTFKVYFPAYQGAEEPLAAPATAPPAPGGSETVLLAEDDAQLRAVVRDILQGKGYQVLEAKHPADALSLSRGHAGPIHLLLTDVMMPKMGGRQLAAQLLVERPALRVLYMSGYTDNVIVMHDVVEAGLVLLQKPFTPAALLRKVRESL